MKKYRVMAGVSVLKEFSNKKEAHAWAETIEEHAENICVDDIHIESFQTDEQCN